MLDKSMLFFLYFDTFILEIISNAKVVLGVLFNQIKNHQSGNLV